MRLEIRDLAGLSGPAEKLIQLVSDGAGAIYRPFGMRREADAEAYKIRSIASAEAEARVISTSSEMKAQLARVKELAGDNPDIFERARLRLLTREIEGLQNIEAIADHALNELPNEVSDDPVALDWRRRFFSGAEDVCDDEMQIIWGKVLAGEVASPGRFSLRTLEILKNLSKHEAEKFQKICSFAFSDGWIPNPIDHSHKSINDRFRPFGICYDDLLALRSAGLMHDNDYSYKVAEMPSPNTPLQVHYNCNGIWMAISSNHTSKITVPSFDFTRAGIELQSLVKSDPAFGFLNSIASYFRLNGFSVKKLTSTTTPDGIEVSHFTEDY